MSSPKNIKNFPELQGSPKQIAWAEDIREYRFKLISGLKQKLLQHVEDYPESRAVKSYIKKGRIEKGIAKYDFVLDAICEETKAEAFINERYGWNRTRGNVDEEIETVYGVNRLALCSWIDDIHERVQLIEREVSQ